MANDDGRRVTKADFVWAMVRLAQVDREAYRVLRERGWTHATLHQFLDGKSELPN